MREYRLTTVVAEMVVGTALALLGCGGGVTTPKDTGTAGDGLPGDVGGDGGVGDILLAEAGDLAGNECLPGTDACGAGGDGLPGDGLPGDWTGDATYEPCLGNTDCESGYCVAGPDGKVCAEPCVEECPKGWLCTQVQSQPDVLFVCTWPHQRLCWPCDANGDCLVPGGAGENFCVGGDEGTQGDEDGGDEGGFCATQCEGDATCPEGYVCQGTNVEGTTKNLCRAQAACECTEAAVSAGAWSSCSVTNEIGVCTGKRQCVEAGLPPACDAMEATAETCNNLDDDCDGEVDDEGADGCIEYLADGDKDGFGGKVLGCYCADPGQGTLVFGDCDDDNPALHPKAEELCNGADDDCDGETDEAGATGCVNLYLDPDADGFGAGFADCVCADTAGYVAEPGDCGPDDPNVYPGAQELCNDLDDDCNNETDEGSPADCTPFYLDEDSDGSGVESKFQCLCKPTPPYSAALAGDCNDQDATVGAASPRLPRGATTGGSPLRAGVSLRRLPPCDTLPSSPDRQ